MQILVLIAFAATLAAAGFQPVLGPTWLLAAGLVAYWVGAMVLARAASRCVVIGIARHGDVTPAVLKRRGILAAAISIWLVAGSVGIVELGLGSLADLHHWPLVDKLILLGPFTLAMLLVWTQEYPGHLAQRLVVVSHQRAMGWAAPEPWTLREFLSYNLRHQFLFIAVPVCLILLGQDILSLYVAPWLIPTSGHEFTLGAATAGGLQLLWVLVIFIIAPAIIVRIWRTEPMPASVVRSRLEEMSRRLGLRYRQILLWKTGGTISNAGVMGLVAPVRYILMTDALLNNMSDEQVEAVFAHEAGHIVSHHILYSVVFAAATTSISMAMASLVAVFLPWPDAGYVVMLVILVAMWVFGFGWISRRFERQSDVTAAWAMGLEATSSNPVAAGGDHVDAGRIGMVGASIFASGLERVAQLNGQSYHQRNWRHGSVAWRVGYILWLGGTGGSRRQIDRLVSRIKLALWVGLLLSLILLAAEWMWQG